MKKTKTRVIYAVLREYENGATMKYLAQKYGLTHGTISKWKKKYGTLAENVPCLAENVPCSTENVPSLTEDVPCSRNIYPDWFPEELKGQNTIDIEYDLWMKYAEKLPYDKVLETPWIAFCKKYGQYMQKNN